MTRFGVHGEERGIVGRLGERHAGALCRLQTTDANLLLTPTDRVGFLIDQHFVEFVGIEFSTTSSKNLRRRVNSLRSTVSRSGVKPMRISSCSKA